MLSASPVEVGMYNGETETNLNEVAQGEYESLPLPIKWCSLVEDGSKELETGLDLSFRVFGLNDRADDSDVHVLGANVVGGRNHGNVDI